MEGLNPGGLDRRLDGGVGQALGAGWCKMWYLIYSIRYGVWYKTKNQAQDQLPSYAREYQKNHNM